MSLTSAIAGTDSDVVPASSSVGSVLVTFFTSTCELHMPSQQTYNIPVTITTEGLQRLVDSVLESNVPFDFLINDEFITTTLERFLRRRAMNFEQVLSIEYTPAMQAEEGSKVPHDDWVSSVRAPVAGNPTVLITAAYDHCVRLWSNEECIAIGYQHTEAVKEIALHPDTQFTPLHSAGKATSSGKQHGNAKRKKDSDVPSMRFVSAGKDGRLCAWEYAAPPAGEEPSSTSLQCIGVVQPHVGAADTVDVSSDGSLVASGSWDTSVKVFRWESVLDATTAPDKKAPQLSLTDHARGVLSTRFSASRGTSVLYSSGLDGAIKSWDLEEGQLMSTLTGDHSVHSLSVLPNGSTGDLVLAGCTDNRVRLYDSRQAAVVKTFAGHRQWVYGVSWLWRRDDTIANASAGSLFTSASEDATVRVWDLRSTSSALVTLDSLHTDGVLDVTYVGNSEIASGGKDNRTKTFSLRKEGAAALA